jgi:hypothetical protein
MLPQRESTLAFSARIGATLGDVATALRSRQPIAVTAELRAHQQAFTQTLEPALDLPAQRDLALALIHASDRITDSVDTLAHLLETNNSAAAADLPAALDTNSEKSKLDAAKRVRNR